MLFALTTLLSIPLLAAANGVEVGNHNWPVFGHFARCPVESATLDFPGFYPYGQVPNAITLGVGVQNYTCSDDGTYKATGAVAKLYDISCLLGTPEFATVQDEWFALEPYQQQVLQAFLDRTILLVSDHYFIANSSGTGISPKFASAADGGKSFTIVARVSGIPAPDPKNIDFLHLTNIEGDFAKTTLRVDTKAGQPPAHCKPGSGEISVPYASKYWFFK